MIGNNQIVLYLLQWSLLYFNILNYIKSFDNSKLYSQVLPCYLQLFTGKIAFISATLLIKINLFLSSN